MNTQKLDRIVVEFVSKVRALLDDLDDETRADLLEGLEADLLELVEERGHGALPTPEQYADDLRAAAGLPARRGTALLRDRVRKHQQRPAQPLDERFDAWCDRWRDRVLSRTQGRLAPAWSFVQAVRPGWWVLRGYLLVMAADVLTGPWEPLDLVPQLGVWMLGPLVTVAAIVASVQVGRGRMWPGTGAPVRVHARAGLLLLNIAAVLALAPVVGASGNLTHGFGYTQSSAWVDQSGLRLGGRRICNIQPYDAQGRPLEGVQLFDQDGNRITSSCNRWDEGSNGRHLPWASFGEDRWNVFPQLVRSGRKAEPEMLRPDPLRVAPVELAVVPAEEEVVKVEKPRKRATTRPGEDRRGTRTPQRSRG